MKILVNKEKYIHDMEVLTNYRDRSARGKRQQYNKKKKDGKNESDRD